MNQIIMNEMMISDFGKYLYEEEKSKATIEKYVRDVKKYYGFLSDEKCICKETMIVYKKYLSENYKTSSANSMLASINSFLDFIGLTVCRVKQFRTQRVLFCQKEKELTREEYERLVYAAKKQKNERISLLMQAICSTGIRVSEHRFITVDAIEEGCLHINNKGKSRIVFLSPELVTVLKSYCKDQRIKAGSVFITKNGLPVNRSNIWSMMKSLCKEAGVDSKKVYPHNLRHLFAFTFYGIEKDILRLADVLGHTSIETTRIYTVSSGNEHRRILSKLNLIIGFTKKTHHII